jgi:hypothetical protein
LLMCSNLFPVLVQPRRTPGVPFDRCHDPMVASANHLRKRLVAVVLYYIAVRIKG